MKTKLLSLLFFFIISKNFAQTDNTVIGEWQFYNFSEDTAMDEGKRATGMGLFSSMQFNFKADKTYVTSVLGIAEAGTWKLNNNTLELVNENGGKTSCEIVKFEKDLLSLKMRDKGIILGRKGANLPPVVTKTKAETYVRASNVQLCKKWYLKQKTAPQNMTEQQKEAFAEMLSGSYIEFKTNGGYTSQTGDAKENGKWRFDEGDTAVITQKGNNTAKHWYILKITATDLVLVNSDKTEEWTYSTFAE